MDLDLAGRTALVTGGSAGIGLATARAFAREGCNLHLAARGSANLAAAKQAILAECKVSVTCHAADLADSAQVRKLAADCGRLDILINNAGAIPGGTIESIDEETWRRAWDLKVFGYINLTREVYREMCKARSGAIVNVIGLAGERPKPNYIAGAGGNAALMGFSRAIGADAPSHGVRALAVNPGLVKTERLIRLARDRARLDWNDESRWEEVIAEQAKSLPFGRAATPEEIANVVVFLASPRASYVSGTVVTVDAGYGNFW
ncbi:MAG: SDR family oxidoreductase [Betaproteobacteria bacterium]|nr:SDR family oxidoreductase [Betaproteobacteria bacterium]